MAAKAGCLMMKVLSMGETKRTEKRYIWMDVARTVAVISISCNHAVNRVWDNYNYQTAEFAKIGYFSSLLKACLTVFSHLGVPLFLMLSGALLLKKKMETMEDVRRFYKHNLLPVLITAEVWYFIMYWFLVLLKPGAEYAALSTGELWLGCLKTLFFLDQVTLGSMWYIPMILMLYLMVPVFNIVIHKVSVRVLLLPALAVLLSCFVMSNINSLLTMLGEKALTFELNYANTFSGYALFLLGGYILSERGLERLPSALLLPATLVSYGLNCCYQFWSYAQPGNYLLSYNFIGILICSILLFECLRRFGDRVGPLKSVFSYLSKRAFGIYFVHVL
ncbi:MAG: acyltransferase, partial [Oscillospiraceae bacterium]|nr:acyltransferase [Oscillospiraceae bacterium]